ncbi:hypothetical protein [Saccharolobus sp. A20]|uniref:hypothetical protein n=1 Tax=Saccharolobus sp. A20 TaxID=1891280 RepID=UPI0012EAA069|nr:hypothetical protein [Sulfolobus sp. A20]
MLSTHRSLVELVFRSLKHRLASIDFTWNSTRNTITRWLKIFFLIYNTIYSKSISISCNKILWGG